ncbi:MAG: zinc carboxypeptidase, partial [Ginsengibacter sp.]
DKNNIQYGTGSGSAKGYNYLTKKEESFSIANGDLVISSSQPRAALLKVLFEPKTKLADSVTYDITAWAIPYAFGLKSYATQQAVTLSPPAKMPGFKINSEPDGYGYVIRWQGMSSAKTVAQLLKKDIRLHFAKEPFTSGENSFGRGSIIILKNGNEKFGSGFWQMVSDVCNTNKTELIPVASGMVDQGLDFGSPSVSIIKKVNVAMLTGENIASTAAGEVWNFFDNELKYKITLVNAGNFADADWSDIDVLIMPDGNYKFLKEKSAAAKMEGWIKDGGKVIAIEGAVAQLSKQSWSAIHSKYDSTAKDTTKKDPYIFLKSYESRERNRLSDNTPGAIYKVDIDNTHPLMFGYPDHYYTLKMDTAVYKFIEKGGWNTGVIKKDSQVAGFVGYKLAPKLKDGLLFGVQDLGRGNIVYLSDDVLFRDFWENGKLMFCNAVFLVGE